MTTDFHPFTRLVHRIDSRARLLRVWPLTGGVSAQVAALEIARPDGSTQKMILRRHGDADYNENPNIAADEFRLLTLLHNAGIPAPAPCYLDERAEFFPRPSLVMEFIDGSTVFTPDDLPDFLRQMAVTLHRIHTFNNPSSDLAFLPDQAEIVTRKLATRPERFDDSIRERRIRDVLEAAWPFPHRNQTALLHGDYWLGNLIWRGGGLVGVIDWEDARLGDPLEDLGKTRLELLWSIGLEAMEGFTAAYQSLMPSLDFTDQPYWDLYAAQKAAFRLDLWAETEAQERTMRQRLHWFVDMAFEQLA